MSDLSESLASESLSTPQARLRLVDALAQDVTPQVDSAARKMIADGDALLVKNTRTSAHGFVLDQDHYDTRLEWTPTEFNAICACEQRAAGFVCPHIWATVLLADKSGAFRPLEEARSHPLLLRNTEGADKRRSPNAWPAKPGWKIHLASLAQSAARRASEALPSRAGLARHAVYIIDAVASAQDRHAITVELFSRQQKRTRNGEGWTRPQPLRLDPREIDTFTDSADRDILGRIVGARPQDPISAADENSASLKTCVLRGAVGLKLLREMVETGRTRLRASAFVEPIPVSWSDETTLDFLIRISPHDDGKHYTLSGHLAEGDRNMPLSVAQLFSEPAPGEPGVICIQNKLMPIRFNGGLEWIDLFSTRGALHVPKVDGQDFLRNLATLPAVPKLDLPEELAFEQLVGAPRAKLILKKPVNTPFTASGRSEETVLADVLFDYESGPVEAHTPAAGVYDAAARKMILRDKPAEARALAILKSTGFRRNVDPDTHEPHYELPARFLPRTVPTLIREGWTVEAEGKLYRAASDFRISVASGIDWFDLTGSVQFGDQVVPLPRLLSAARKGEHLIRLADGTFGVLPEEWLSKYGVIVRSGQTTKDEQGAEAIRFSRAQAGMLDVLLESQPHATADETFLSIRDHLRAFTGVEALPAPAGFTGELRPYQRDGLGWFKFLREFSFGGCLADDMGLGKTIQVLALLESRRAGANGKQTKTPAGAEAKNGKAEFTPRPSLVVAPRSLVFNWKQEAAKFAPGLRILDHTGPNRPRTTERFFEYDLILTTYGTLRSDILFLKDFKWDYAILDEAQAIKNAQTESAKAVRLLSSEHRLALSGTPVQNHLGELWSLFEFLNPGMLGAAAVFDSRYQTNGKKNGKTEPLAAAPAGNLPAVAAPEAEASIDEDEPDETPRQLLSRALRPFILRRTKEQVAQELPPCTEQTILCELDEAQRTLYDELRDHYRQSLLGGGNKSLNANRMQVLEALLRLRQASCHAGLIDKTRISEPSAKLDVLLEQLEEILDEGHKALVFSQFTSLLAIVRNRLDNSHTRYAYLDGKTRDRKSPVEQFQNDPETKLFLVSLKAGGLGLNLTGADYVFLLDPWWNPAVEAQAIDRAHRIGQTRHVFAYRLIAKDTVEEKVLQLQQTKRDLADAIISENNALLSTLTADDLQILLS